MRWVLDPLKGRVGEQRVVSKFLLWPRSFNNEVRWLETCDIREEVQYVQVTMYDCEYIRENIEWVEIGFEKP